ncbi:hypothetical protein HTV80_12525 [Streptomyces sp. Vc74B-19]|uniref:hypothetical protein n=1 Tax=Streptomyces sp. Vc74B-19 TaxID=2741324 RepID=UPI001BFCB616|nr:hypothetical protein [Streptomyces sp. Vc74B-19]MBT3163933.1 hypothetical protein [Streptomyces sp. Vc74B-19]
MSEPWLSEDAQDPPNDYNLIVPDGWFKLSLDPDERDRSIAALAQQQFRGMDNVPHLKDRVMRELQKTAKDAYQAGGIELYLSTLTIGSLPLSSSLLVSLPVPGAMPPGADVHTVVATMRQSGADVALVTLAAAGRSIRELRTDVADPSVQLGSTLPTTTVKYYIPVPASDEWLILSFSTPLDPLAKQMTELFDAVAGTLHWT